MPRIFRIAIQEWQEENRKSQAAVVITKTRNAARTSDCIMDKKRDESTMERRVHTTCDTQLICFVRLFRRPEGKRERERANCISCGRFAVIRQLQLSVRACRSYRERESNRGGLLADVVPQDAVHSLFIGSKKVITIRDCVLFRQPVSHLRRGFSKTGRVREPVFAPGLSHRGLLTITESHRRRNR